MMFTKFVLQGLVPHKLKYLVYLLHKQGKKDNVKNFRHLSLVPLVSTLLTTAVFWKIPTTKGSEVNPWFKSYLERRMIVKIKQTIDHKKRCLAGIRHGAFFIYSLHLRPLKISCSLVLTSHALLTPSKAVESLKIAAYISVSVIREYYVKNNFIFNECKTKQMNLGRHKIAYQDHLTLQ